MIIFYISDIIVFNFDRLCIYGEVVVCVYGY